MKKQLLIAYLKGIVTEVRTSLIDIEKKLPESERVAHRNLVNEISYSFPCTQPVHDKLKEIEWMIAGLKEQKE